MLKQHPKGLYLLFTTEMWERFSYYGMRAILSLYMIKAMFYSTAFTSSIYGYYTGMVYLTPLIGGYIADRYWGNRKSIIFGGLLMALGQFSLATSSYLYSPQSVAVTNSFFVFNNQTIFFLMGLFLLVLGNGFFKPNISSMVGFLYSDNDGRRDSAFTIFYMGINLGALISPIIIGLLVGDAAGHVNPLTGGGIITALEAGMYAGEVVAAAVKEGDYSEKRLKEYQDICKKEIGDSFEKYLKTKDYMLSLSDADLDSIAEVFKDTEFENISTTELVKLLIKVSPKALLKLGKLF